jgi:uncharacterized damage-inducible protein DinB
MKGKRMSETRRIKDQLRRAFEGEAWHGPSLMELLADVTAEHAAARPIPGVHSIWELVLHIAFWENISRKRIEGDDSKYQAEDGLFTITDSNEAAWQQALEKLKSTNESLREAVAKLDNDKLKEKAAGQEYSIYFLLHGVIQHDLYHAGQIALLKKAYIPGTN